MFLAHRADVLSSTRRKAGDRSEAVKWRWRSVPVLTRRYLLGGQRYYHYTNTPYYGGLYLRATAFARCPYTSLAVSETPT